MKKTLLAITIGLASLAGNAHAFDDNFKDTRSGYAIGALMSGGLLGVEYGYMFTPRVELMGGLGLVGAGVGIGYHLNEGISTSAIVARLESVGLGQATAFKVEYLHRKPNSHLQWSLGLGSYIQTTQEFEDNMLDIIGDELPPVMLTYSLAFFQPN